VAPARGEERQDDAREEGGEAVEAALIRRAEEAAQEVVGLGRDAWERGRELVAVVVVASGGR